MHYRSLLITVGDPPSVTLGESLLPDHAPAEVGGSSVFAGPAPWRANHDLLVHKEGRTLCGLVYPVSKAERSAVLRVCADLSIPFVRYCVSPRFASELLQLGTLDSSAAPRDWGKPAEPVKAFPVSLRPFRQLLRECFVGTRSRSDLPPEVCEDAGEYFRSLAREDYWDEWPGGDVDRVEVVWAPEPVVPGLPSCFPSDLKVEPAQHFAEDVWFYRRTGDGIAGIGINHLDEILSSFGLQLPPSILGGGS